MVKLRAFQLYLLYGMRATAQVEAACRTLGASDTEMADARQRVLAAGLQTLPHRFALYAELLGQDFEMAEHPRGHRYAAKSLRFRLPLWDAFDWVVYGSAEGIVGEARFERRSNEVKSTLPMDNFEVWQVVEGDLPTADWQWEIGDEWYPMKDFIGSHRNGRRIALCFDYGLLQKVGILEGPRISR